MSSKAFWCSVLREIGVWRIAVRLLAMACCYLGYFLQPLLLGSLVDGATPAGEALVLLAVSVLCVPVVDMLNNGLLQGVRSASKRLIVREVARRPYSYVLEHPTGEILSHLQEVSLASRYVETLLATVMIKIAVMAVLYTVLLSFAAPLAGMVYVAAALAYTYLSWRLAGANRPNISRALQASARAQQAVQEYCDAIESIISSDAQEYERARVDDAIERERCSYADAQRVTNRHELMLQSGIVAASAAVAMLVFAGERGAWGISTMLLLLYSIISLSGIGGQVLQLAEMQGKIVSGLKELFGETSRLCREAQGAPSAERGQEASPGALADGVQNGQPLLAIHDLSFAYPRHALQFEHLSCHFDRPGLYALTGPNGSGTSTLLKLMAGLLQAHDGSIELASGLHRPVYLAQRSVLFNRSLWENIAYPGLDVSEDDALSILAELGMGHIVSTVEGLHGLMPGDMKNKLSGGEQQKVLIARGIISRPDVLLCDEITSGLDCGSSRAFYRLVRERLPHAVVLCTVHRADELDQFDRVFSLAELCAPADAGQ